MNKRKGRRRHRSGGGVEEEGLGQRTKCSLSAANLLAECTGEGQERVPAIRDSVCLWSVAGSLYTADIIQKEIGGASCLWKNKIEPLLRAQSVTCRGKDFCFRRCLFFVPCVIQVRGLMCLLEAWNNTLENTSYNKKLGMEPWNETALQFLCIHPKELKLA